MYRTVYDCEFALFSPQGRLYQVEYAMEASHQGSTTVVGVRGHKYTVLMVLKPSFASLRTHLTPQDKLAPLDESIGGCATGIAKDVINIIKYIRLECAAHRHQFGSTPNVNRILWQLGRKMQAPTQNANKRPYGIAMLVANYDDELGKPKLYHICSSAVVNECKAYAIGRRSNRAIAYLEKHYVGKGENNLEWGVQELMLMALDALKSTLHVEETFTAEDLAAAVVGFEQPFRLLAQEDVSKLLDKQKERKSSTSSYDSSNSDSSEDNTEKRDTFVERPAGTIPANPFSNDPVERDIIMDRIVEIMEERRERERLRKENFKNTVESFKSNKSSKNLQSTTSKRKYSSDSNQSEDDKTTDPSTSASEQSEELQTGKSSGESTTSDLSKSLQTVILDSRKRKRKQSIESKDSETLHADSSKGLHTVILETRRKSETKSEESTTSSTTSSTADSSKTLSSKSSDQSASTSSSTASTSSDMNAKSKSLYSTIVELQKIDSDKGASDLSEKSSSKSEDDCSIDTTSFERISTHLKPSFKKFVSKLRRRALENARKERSNQQDLEAGPSQPAEAEQPRASKIIVKETDFTNLKDSGDANTFSEPEQEIQEPTSRFSPSKSRDESSRSKSGRPMKKSDPSSVQSEPEIYSERQRRKRDYSATDPKERSSPPSTLRKTEPVIVVDDDEECQQIVVSSESSEESSHDDENTSK